MTCPGCPQTKKVVEPGVQYVTLGSQNGHRVQFFRVSSTCEEISKTKGLITNRCVFRMLSMDLVCKLIVYPYRVSSYSVPFFLSPFNV